MKNASTNPGIWPNPWGAPASGLPFSGAQITAEELQRGEITHVIGISLPALENWNIFSWPANRSDGWNPSNAPNRIPEGLRFRLDPALNVDALNIHPVAKVIAKAGTEIRLRRGRLFWRDCLQGAESEVGHRARTTRPVPGTLQRNGVMGDPQQLSLDRMIFLPFDYGKPEAKGSAGALSLAPRPHTGIRDQRSGISDSLITTCGSGGIGRRTCLRGWRPRTNDAQTPDVDTYERHAIRRRRRS